MSIFFKIALTAWGTCERQSRPFLYPFVEHSGLSHAGSKFLDVKTEVRQPFKPKVFLRL